MKINFHFSAFIGAVGSWLANITAKLLIYLRIDDAVGATCVHGKLNNDVKNWLRYCYKKLS